MAETLCSKVYWTENEYNVGYIPANTDVDLSGLLAITIDADFPFPVTISIDSPCAALKFPGEGGYTYNYTFTATPGNTYYIPFRINLEDDCGEFNCTLTYIFEYETEEGSFSCTAETNIYAYNATCDFQKCLLSASEAYCSLDIACIDDICKDPCYHRFIKLWLIDDALEFKALKKDWTAVNDLYDQALNQICNCDCEGNPNAKTEEVIDNLIQNDNE